MNTTPRLRSWAAQWTASRLFSDSPLAPPEAPKPDSGASFAGGYAVTSQGSFAGGLVAQLHAAIMPDDAQKAERSGAFAVSASGRRLPRVPIVRGQIRQLNPELNPSWTRSILVLVLRLDESGEKALVVPFGEFTEPAFEGELATDLRDHSMAVLCVWNASWVPFDWLGRSWWLTDAFDDLLQDASALYDARTRREPVPASLQSRTGPPILHPLDPRHDYLDLEAGLLELLA